MKIINLISALIILFLLPLTAQEENKTIEKRKYFTSPLSNEKAPVIDGEINDDAWNKVEWSTDFTQRDPEEGIPPTEKTQFKIIYDEKFMYIAVECLDSEPDKINKRLSRRDGFEGDWFIVSIDSYHDLTTAFCFNVTAAGVKGDEVLTANGNQSDSNWNPIWFTKSKINNNGWSAELKIPFSQLRFSSVEDQIWGLQVSRKIFRKNERTNWQHISKSDAGWVSNFGELHGLKNIKPKRQVELQPYVVGSIETYEKENNNPYKDGLDTKISTGIDGKIGITNDITLDFTINPDFGQVEADPAAITLDAFQIFFNEQRPFFIENKNIFDYGVSRSEAGNTFWNDNLFYSRRIGGSPSYYPGLNENEYAKQPSNTTILGAAKISGQTKNGWSIGVLETMTSKEFAKIDLDGEERKELVEPLTNYFVGRAKKDFNNRNSNIGGIFTATNRKIEGNLDFLHKSAYTGGLDFEHRWKERAWYVKGNTVISHVNGSKDAILNTQYSIGHLFHRVDADYLSIDTTKTSLTGLGGHVKIGKVGNGNFMFESGIAWRTPELELNDLGFQRTADDIRHFTWAGYAFRNPFSIFNRMQFNYNHWMVYDFGGNLNSVSWNLNMNTQFKNNWSMGTGCNINPYQFSNSELRGGPRYRFMPGGNTWFWGNSDHTKNFRFGWNVSYGGTQNKEERSLYTYAYILYQPINALNISINSNYNIVNKKLQYVSENNMDNDARYIMGSINQKTVGISLRLNYTINPNLSIQYYGQPFIARGQYSDFKHITDPTARSFNDKFEGFSTSQVRLEDNIYSIDENKDGQNDYSFSNPDFAFVQFRSNLVMRWEYIPGSELFFVWSQGGTGFGDPNERLGTSFNDQIINRKLQNIFLIKATYRFIK